MTTIQLLDLLKACTELEIAALRSALVSSEGNGHDFGYTDDIVIPGKSKKAVGGVISSLLKKDILTRDNEFGQFCFGDRWDDTRHFAADVTTNYFKKSLSRSTHDVVRRENRKRRRAARKVATLAAKAENSAPDAI